MRNIVALIISLFLLGCSKEQADNLARPVYLADLKDTVVLVQVNGEPLTYGDFRRKILFEAACRKVQGEFEKDPDAERRFKIIRETELLPELVNSYLVAQEAKSEGVCATEEEVAAYRQELASAPEGAIDFRKVVQEKGLTEKYLQNILAREVTKKKLLYKLYPDLHSIGSNEVREVRERIRAINGNVIQSNEVLRASANLVLEQARKPGANFAKLAKAHSWTSPEEGERWTTFTRSDIEDEKFREWAFSAQVGAVGGPFETEDGLSIVKVLSHQAGAKSESVVSVVVEQVDLARIILPQLQKLAEDIPDEELMRCIREARTRESMQELLTRLRDQANLVYPMGTDFRSTGASRY